VGPVAQLVEQRTFNL